ncbi:MAG: OmpA family protein, partial [Prevotellaceae bacterium]|nr:OmpA family protein [Prevotellaceae bacterium]
MSAIFPRIFSFFAVLVAIAALAACGAEKKVSQAPIPDFKPPQELPAVEQKAPEPPAPEEADEAKAGKSRSKKEKRTPVEEEYDEEEEEEEEEDVLDNSNIFFQYASAELSPAAKRELARVAAIMKRNKSARVTLTGHTCDKSSASVNIRLSQKRANAASGYLQ